MTDKLVTIRRERVGQPIGRMSIPVIHPRLYNHVGSRTNRDARKVTISQWEDS
jgi:hypothetical protein